MNAAGLRRCVEEKEAVAAAYADLSDKSSKECRLYERDLERAMESCDDLARENDDLRARLNQNTDVSCLLFFSNGFLTTDPLLKNRAFHCLVVFKIDIDGTTSFASCAVSSSTDDYVYITNPIQSH